MAFDSTLATPLTAAKALQADQSDPERLENKLVRRARQSQTLANKSAAGGPLSSFPAADVVEADVAGAATEAAFATNTTLFTPQDAGTRGDIAVGTKFKIRAICSVTSKNAADTCKLQLRIGSDATIGNNLSMTATNATNCGNGDIIILESEGTVGAVGASGKLFHYSWNTGDNNWAGTNNAPAAISFGDDTFDTTALGLQPKVQVTAEWSSGNATNVVKLDALEVQCVATNEALAFE